MSDAMALAQEIVDSIELQGDAEGGYWIDNRQELISTIATAITQATLKERDAIASWHNQQVTNWMRSANYPGQDVQGERHCRIRAHEHEQAIRMLTSRTQS